MLKLDDILVIDIETVPLHEHYDALNPTWKKLWDKKANMLDKGAGKTAAEWYERAGIYAEFGKIICIAFGAYFYEGKTLKVKIKSLQNDDEKFLLEEFADFLETNFNKTNQLLCAHNGKEFDYPYICRRMLVNGIKIPSILDISEKKPWEVPHLDTMEMWKFGDYKSFTSLDLMAALFEIPSPKDDIDGSQVGAIYWKEGDLDRIAHYCKKDVATTARLLAKLKKGIQMQENDLVIV